MRKRNCAEKIDETTNAFLNVKQMPDIEFAFWRMGLSNNTGKCVSNCLVSVFTGLRIKFSY